MTKTARNSSHLSKCHRARRMSFSEAVDSTRIVGAMGFLEVFFYLLHDHVGSKTSGTSAPGNGLSWRLNTIPCICISRQTLKALNLLVHTSIPNSHQTLSLAPSAGACKALLQRGTLGSELPAREPRCNIFFALTLSPTSFTKLKPISTH